jgi:DNA integrity scanning protein DisA with diadenylate cyclase activity
MKHVSFFATVQEFLSQNFFLYTWRDGVEILLLSSILYGFMRWLSKDISKKPLIFFICYGLMTAVTYYMGFTIVSTLLLVSTPLTLILSIIMHQHTLQKNMIAYKTIKPEQESSYLWLDELMRSVLGALNKDKEIICIIERNDSLREFLGAPYTLNADLKKSVLEMLFDHVNEASSSMLWINESGKIIAINAFVKTPPDPDWISSDIKHMPLIKQDVLFLTSKTDAIVVCTSSRSRTFECIVEGKDIKDLSAAHALNFLKRFFIKKTQRQKDTTFHASNNRSTIAEQQLS